MDFVSNLFKKSKSKNITPEKQPGPCDNQNKNTHLFDMESSFLQNSVMIPAEFDSNQNGESDGTNNSNQENQKPRYSILNSFDPIIKKESDELSCNENEKLNKSAEFSNTGKTFVNPVAEDFAKISAAVSDTLGTELNKSSVSNISTQSDNSVLNNTVILNKSLTVENITPVPEETNTDANRSLNGSSTVKHSEQNLNTEDQSLVNGKSNLSHNLSTTLKPIDIPLPNVSDLIKDTDLNTPEQTFIIGSVSLDASSTLEPDASKVEITYTTENSIVADDISLNVPLTSTPIPDEQSVVIKTEQNIKSVIDHLKLKGDIESADDSLINAFATKLVLSPNEKKSDNVLLEKDINTDEEISNEQIVLAVNELKVENKEEEVTVDLNKCEIISTEPTDIIAEIPHEISVESVKIVNDLIEDLNQINVASDEKECVEINEAPEAITNETISVHEINTSNSQVNEELEFVPNKDISFDINTHVNEPPEIITNKNISIEINNSNSQVIEDLNETLTNENIKECSLKNKNVSFEVTNTIPQIVAEAPNKIHLQSLNSTYEKSITVKVENIILSSTLEAEETHMSASEPNSGLNEPTVANRLSLETSATCTNEMGEIINQNECFEKQSDITNGAIDNKESLEAKARVYKEMAEQYVIVEAECEKFKVQVADLKKELKICRQKTVTLETEVADLKRRENELNVLLAEYKQSATGKGDANDQDEQLNRLQASEAALKNEVKELNILVSQHESRLKELQRKEVKLADDLTSKTQSEIQISRVMEEYEKSISTLLSDNEKMKKERDTVQMHLTNIEMAFSDVHQKYERCKSIVQGYKDNEESYKQDIAMNRETIVIQEQKYESLKAHAMNQLEKSNQELATMKKQHETEMARLTAQLKRYEIKNQSLMESLQQKAKECEQLSAVCDEFIGNV